MPTIWKLINDLVDIIGVSSTTANEQWMAGEDFLKGLQFSWEDYNATMNRTAEVLMYMDRVYCVDNRKASIFTTSMGRFRDHILRSQLATTDSAPTTFDILNHVILGQINKEREGDVINKNLIRSCIYMLEGLYETDEEKEDEKLYLTSFELAFLKTSKVFYQNECLALLQDSDASTWLRQTKKRLAEEEARCETTISSLTSQKIAKVVEAELVSGHLEEFLAMEGSGIKAMIENDRYEDLRTLYQLVSRVGPSMELLKNALQIRVVELGSEINKTILNTDISAAIKWVVEILQLKDKIDTMWKNCLNEDLILQTALTKSFSDSINLFPRCSEYVSLFINSNLRRNIKGKTEAEVDDDINKTTALLRYIQDKDMFERYYKKHLARRLLYGRSGSAAVEKQIISRIKLEIGNSFTTELNGMFKDMSLSEELTSGYRAHIQNLGDMDRTRIDLGINGLTTKYWPMESVGGSSARGEDGQQSCSWPSEIHALQESFKAYCLKERNGRVLTWVAFLGNADICCIFPKVPGKESMLGRERRYEINIPTYGMIILMLFNDLADGEYLLFEGIQERTNIPTTDLARMLFILSVLPKARVLIKQPANKDLPKPGDKFMFNTSFTSKLVKIKAPNMVGAVNRVENDEERKDSEDRNNEYRGNVIDTAIVRIMKFISPSSHVSISN